MLIKFRLLLFRKYCSPSSADMVKVLNIAEKNDAAKTLANVMSRGSARKREGFSKFNKIYEFNYNILNKNCLMMMTSVSGHLLELDFVGQYRKWNSCNPLSLFDIPVEKKCPEKFNDIKRTLEREAGSSQYLIIWTDCDREGENIGFEAIQVCKAVNPNLPVYRARFSEITPQAVARACSNLVAPDKRTSDAVDVRQELDLRIGAAFTRFQTMRLQKIFPEALAEKLISYGSCQFPTLGFVVERYKQVQAFIPEPFWKIKVTHIIDDATKCEFSWKRNRLFDHNACLVLYEQCIENPEAKVTEVKCKPKSKWRPVPLDTVEMEKLASRKLRLSAKETMRIAENLYTKGFISYPRTETNMFPKDLDLAALVQEQTRDPNWGGFASGILQDRPNPRNGNKTDQAHPPIHPIKYTDTLQGNDARLYEFIVRHFLATCSKDAQGQETTVSIDIAEEKFSAQGLMITARNYLDVYPYDKWNAKTIPVYQEGEVFDPSAIDMLFSETSPPPLLTEADLIALMEKHGIGTDATHAEHIETIKTRMYVGLNQDSRFVPGQLGMGLVEGYDAMGYEMSKPHLRSELEADLKRICEGKKDKNVVLSQQVSKYKEVFKVACEQALKIDQALAQYLGEARDLPVEEALDIFASVPVKKCPSCGMDMTLKTRKTGGFYIGCMGFPSCRSAIWLPNFVLDASVSDVKCENCQAQLMNFKFKMGSVPPMLPLQYTGCVAGCDNLLSESLQINNISETRGGNSSSGEGGGGGLEFERNSNVNCNCGKPAKTLTVNKDGPNKGRTFYACANPRDQSCNFFQWGDEISEGSNNSKAPPFRSDTQSSQRVPLVTVQPFNRQTNDEDDGQDIVCNCGTSAILLTVRKEGPNQGRQFYKCGGSNCNFFLWADQSQNQSTDNNRRPPGGGGGGFNNQSSDMELNCNCGTPARLLRVVKDGPNKDREFYSCSKPRGQGCDFFQWSDVTNENRSNGGGFGGGFQTGGNSDICCNCGNPAKMLTVNKDGPNKGRTFYACAKPRDQSCKFFQWGDENPEGINTGSYVGSGGKKRTSSELGSSGTTPNRKRAARKCGLCGEEGHTKRTCPHK